jgi:hypothetical protein
LTTPGGQAEAVEKLVEVVRNHYPLVYFVVPVAAMSAGTIFCMSGDKIYMDYSSSLGPIDPQVPDREGKFLIPALGHLDKVNEIIEKSRSNTITPVEFQWLLSQDLAMLRFYEQARDLSTALLEKWLVQYKFKDWLTHRTNNPGATVTASEKQARATEIAKLLSNNAHWHSHGRMIGIKTLKEACKLDIDDYGTTWNCRNWFGLTTTPFLTTCLDPRFGFSSTPATSIKGLPMSVSDEIERLRQYPNDAPEAFREQLSRAQAQRVQVGQPVHPQGIDRSGELAPLPRPTIVRALVEGS